MATHGILLPEVAPVGGHRGPLYLGDLIRVVDRASYRSWRWFYVPSRSNELGVPSHLVGASIGDPDPSASKTLNPWGQAKPLYQGIVGNVRYGMVPEFPMTEDVDDVEKGLHALGWRLLLRRWLEKRWISPTDEVRALLGESDYYRYQIPE